VAAPLLPYLLDTHVIVGGPSSRVHRGERVALSNAILNVSSGEIYLGDRTMASYHVMLLTGRHLYVDGMRASWPPEYDDGTWGGGRNEVPSEGWDIRIGRGVWLGAGVIVLGGVTIGDHCVVGAGAVVTRSAPDHSFLAGVPARRVGDTRDWSTARPFPPEVGHGPTGDAGNT